MGNTVSFPYHKHWLKKRQQIGDSLPQTVSLEVYLSLETKKVETHYGNFLRIMQDCFSVEIT